MITFQELIQRLAHFWEKQGCILHVGHDLEVGAGTFNPATFLRSLGPEPYKTAYVEPSRRPADGRYGENPNRVQLFHQFQVVLKPPPENVQGLCVKSLAAIGLDLKEHDIRFVCDDWEAPTLGAWGLGWELWCDGMEICQFTYFQAIASLPLKVIAAEITYGLERVAMFLQGVDKIFDVHWNDHLTFKDIAQQSEIEWSTYNFSYASVEMWKDHFEDFEKEAKTLIALHLPIPAYDFIIKASHAFNLLDSRGVISVTERTGYIARIRELARLIAVEYLVSREKLGFPLLKETPPQKKRRRARPAQTFNPENARSFLLEIGSEELPAAFVRLGCESLEKLMRQFLEANDLSFKELDTYATPRRIAILIKGLIEGSPTKLLQKRGPSLSVAFDPSGHPTPQGAGFFKSIGARAYLLKEVLSGKAKGIEIQNDYLVAKWQQKGSSAMALLAEALPKIISSIDFPKKMHWESDGISYARPIRWIAALFGHQIIPFEMGNCSSSRYSFGHAQLSKKKITFETAEEYLDKLRQESVLVDIQERKSAILNQLNTIETNLSATILEKEKVLNQVLHMTEFPQIDLGQFNTAYLEMPKEILISEMVMHQRYFPLSRNEQLLPSFVITADNTPNTLIRKGNERVLSARLADGAFLYAQDKKHPLDQFNEKLKQMTFQKHLGSMLDKVARISSHASALNRYLAIADDALLMRAALLCKADLATALVAEFPELQGTIGKQLAIQQGEKSEVALAIEEHWMPRFEGDALPKTPCGIVLSLADKLDNLIGYFSVGLKPSSSGDPYALRRQALGILKILIVCELSLDLEAVIADLAKSFTLLSTDPSIKAQVLQEISQFITSRTKSLFEEYHFKKDEIAASLRGLCSNPYDQFCKVQALHFFRSSGDDFDKLHEVYKRAKGQLETATNLPINPSLLVEPAEKELWRALENLEKKWGDLLVQKKYKEAFHLMAELKPPLAHLFNTVKILADDPRLKENRIALLQRIFARFEELVDFGKIQSHYTQTT